jgi:kumamolisin
MEVETLPENIKENLLSMHMKYSTAAMAIAVALLAGCASVAWAQTAGPGGIIVPSSSIAGPNDAGVNAQTNILIKVDPTLATATPAIPGAPGPPFTGYGYNTPASLGCVYSLVLPQAPGCNPNVAYMNPSGGSRAVVILDAFDDPTATADFAAFSTQFGITGGSLTVEPTRHGGALGVCFGLASTPGVDPTGGWEIEESLDIEWAHAMAPNAAIHLVEAQSNSYNDLFCALTRAQAIVVAAGGGEISMSFGGGEFLAEALYNAYFTGGPSGAVYFASSGDSPGTEFPCVSPEVVCVGGTSVGRNPTYLSFTVETAWQVAGGGPSAVFGGRNAPDVSAIADPDTGVWVLDTNPVPGPGWYIVGGTSVASPVWAGIVNRAGSFLNSGSAGTGGSELNKLYGDSSVSGDFTDITIGSCGPYAGYLATTGWDYCTGRGSPRGYAGK